MENQNTDKLEMQIISLMESASMETKDVYGNHRRDGKNYDKVDAGNALLTFENMRPENAIGFDALDEDRLYSSDHKMLLSSVPDIIGDRAEIFVLDRESGCNKWFGYRKLTRRPKGVYSLPSANLFYEFHFRTVFANGTGEYSKRCVAFSGSGKPSPVWARGYQVGHDREINSIVLAASIIEDAARPMSVTATIHESVNITFPVSVDAYKDFFKLREAPMTESGRRKAISHWVRKHIRKSKDAESEVKQHKRGVSEIDINGLKVSLTLN